MSQNHFNPSLSAETHGLNWCSKYQHEIDYDLVHQICESLHPKGCANCQHSTYRKAIFLKVDGKVKRVSFSGEQKP